VTRSWTFGRFPPLVLRCSSGRAGVGSKVMLEHELQRIYESEINVLISWLWDGGIDVRLGDQMNGYLAEENVSSTGDIVPWLQEAIAYFYPHSTYAKSLDPQTRERAARRLFRTPISGAQVRCPDCGAPHAAPPGMVRYLRLCARTAGRAWNHRGLSRVERYVHGNVASVSVFADWAFENARL
jgi:hypothetical protein